MYLTESVKKRAILLHFGGLALQDVYHSLPGAHVEESDNIDVYKVALEKLDQYFFPKQSKIYERHLFRLIKQEEGERFEAFLLRLRTQIKIWICKRRWKHYLIDQITEKCQSSELRKILSLGDQGTLDKMKSIANTLETVEKQMDHMNKQDASQAFGSTREINKIDTWSFQRKEFKQQKTGQKCERCSRCGSYDHTSDDKKCPAIGKTCLLVKCNFLGHFQEHCRSMQKNVK